MEIRNVFENMHRAMIEIEEFKEKFGRIQFIYAHLRLKEFLKEIGVLYHTKYKAYKFIYSRDYELINCNEREHVIVMQAIKYIEEV